MRPKYRPASKLTPEQIAGDCSDGNAWLPWKKDATGMQWYVNASSDAVTTAPKRPKVAAGTILGIPGKKDLVRFITKE